MTTVGYTAGVFDLFHIGHLTHLKEAKNHCDELIVGVTTDELSTSYKHKTPVIPFDERAAIVGALRCVDEVVPQYSMDRWSAWKERKFDLTIVGDDWKGSALWNSYEQRFAEVGVKVIYFPYTSRVSSTLLRTILQRLAETPVDVVAGLATSAA
jgi:glycerol-3-phosphate cytidylyltransferase